MKDEQPLVSVICITYNQKEYIQQCLEGLVIQKTDFLYEIIVHDDASTDDTAKIIKKFECEYPNIVFPIYQKVNQYSKGVNIIGDMFSISKGKYIAMCEGDDYWIDPYKLQKQVDILENNPLVSLVFTERLIQKYNKFYRDRYMKTYYNKSDLLGGLVIGLQTICFRKFVIKKEYEKIHGDILFPYICSLSGNLVCIHKDCAVYRITSTGVASSREKEDVLNMSIDHIRLFHQVFNFPSKRLLIKAQALYIYCDIMRKIRCKNINIKSSFSYFYTYHKNISSSILLLYYLFYHFLHSIILFFFAYYKKYKLKHFDVFLM